MTNWPDAFTIRFEASDGTTAVSDLIILVILLARQKNNYTVGPLRTDTNGAVRLSKGELEQVIVSAMKDFPMDYSSTLGECTGRLRIVVEDLDQLRARLERIREFYPDAARDFAAMIQGCANARVEPTEVWAHVQKNVIVPVRLRRGGYWRGFQGVAQRIVKRLRAMTGLDAMTNRLEAVLENARCEAGKPGSYPFLPEIIQSLEDIRDNRHASRMRRVKMARALERLVMDNVTFSESTLGTAILKLTDEFVEGWDIDTRNATMSGFKQFMALVNEPHADYATISRTLCENFESFSDLEQSKVRDLLNRLSKSRLEHERTFVLRLTRDLQDVLAGKGSVPDGGPPDGTLQLRYLPDQVEQDWLLSRLRRLISQCGHDPFVSAPIVAPTKEFFPDPWDGSVIGVERITRRLLQYAGLGHLDVELSAYSGEAGSSPEDPVHPNRSTVGAFLGIRGGKCRFAVNAQQSDDPEQFAGVMAHEVAHAYRARHKLRQPGKSHQDEEELLTDMTTIYLGFGVLSVNNAHRSRSFGELYGGRAYTFSSTTKIGYLPAQALSFLLAVQLSARETDADSRWELLRHLETDQAAYVKAALREIEEQGLDLSSSLGLPPRETWKPPKRLEEILLPLPAVDAVAEVDSREPGPEEDHTFNAGKPVFRWKMRRRPAYTLWGAVVFGCIGGVLFGHSGWVLAFAVAGFLLGFVLDWRGRQDVCSDPHCGATLEPAAVQCPGCGGTISGRIETPNQRLDGEEEISGTRRLRTHHRKRRKPSRK